MDLEHSHVYFIRGSFTPIVSVTPSGDAGATSVTSNSTSVCTVSGSTVNFVDAGTCSLTVSVVAATDYAPASSTQTFSVGQDSQDAPALTPAASTFTSAGVNPAATTWSTTIWVEDNESSGWTSSGTISILWGESASFQLCTSGTVSENLQLVDGQGYFSLGSKSAKTGNGGPGGAVACSVVYTPASPAFPWYDFGTDGFHIAAGSSSGDKWNSSGTVVLNMAGNGVSVSTGPVAHTRTARVSMSLRQPRVVIALPPRSPASPVPCRMG